MRRELGFVARHTPRRPLLALAACSALEALPAAVSGTAVARSLDRGFLAGRPVIGLLWLGVLLAAAAFGALGAHQVYRRIGDLVEPVRDTLVHLVVAGALVRAGDGRADDSAVAGLTRQVEIVRDTHAGLLVLLSNFVITVIGVGTGLSTLDPAVPVLIGAPFLLGLLAFAATLGMSAARQRDAVRAEERVAAATGQVFAGLRDVTATGSEYLAQRLAGFAIDRQAAAERALARMAAARGLSFAVSGWLPLVVLLVAAPSLLAGGMSVGALLGGLTYVLFGLQPALRNVHAGLGGAGMRFVITLGRILDAAPARPPRLRRVPTPQDYELRASAVRVAYGRRAEPVLDGLDLTIPPGDHLAIVGPSGVGKSTLASVLCGLLTPDAGEVRLGGADVGELDAAQLAGLRVLIPQQSYVFTGTVAENLTYLDPAAGDEEVLRAVAELGATDLVERLGGLHAELDPATLSAGQRQLLALVRAYLSPAPLVVLDEATCHLDPPAERRAEEAFARRDGTLVVIAHRLSSAARARRVLVLDGATPVLGDHHSLADTPLYRDLLGGWNSGELPDAQLPDTPLAEGMYG